MVRMLLGCDSETGAASVEVGATHTFITITPYPGITQVTRSVMNGRNRLDRRSYNGGLRGFVGRWHITIPNNMHNNTAGLLEFYEFVESIVSLRASAANTV